MSKKTVFCLLLAILCCLSLAALADDGISVTDMHGRVITLDAPATRVVAIQPSDCEILCAIGCEDALIGRGQYCDYPETILDRPVVQSGANTNIEEILALKPELVLMNDMAQSEEQVRQLEENGVKVVVSSATDIEGVYYAIRMVGTLMGREENAESVIADMQGTFEKIHSSVTNEGKTIYFEVSPLQYGLYSAGSGTFMDELAEICGLVNVFHDTEGWPAVNEETVIAKMPDYIVSIAGMGDASVNEILGRKGWEEVPAVKLRQVYNADSNAIARPGPRLKDAALELYSFIYGADLENVPAA